MRINKAKGPGINYQWNEASFPSAQLSYPVGRGECRYWLVTHTERPSQPEPLRTFFPIHAKMPRLTRRGSRNPFKRFPTAPGGAAGPHGNDVSGWALWAHRIFDGVLPVRQKNVMCFRTPRITHRFSCGLPSTKHSLHIPSPYRPSAFSLSLSTRQTQLTRHWSK